MNLRILVVEDDEMLVRLFCEVLTEEGMIADSASSLDAAKMALASFDYDIVLLDMLLGNRFGAELLSDLCDRQAAPRVLTMSATAAEQGWAERYRVPFLEKPFVLDALITALRGARRPVRTRPSHSSRIRPAVVSKRL